MSFLYEYSLKPLMNENGTHAKKLYENYEEILNYLCKRGGVAFEDLGDFVEEALNDLAPEICKSTIESIDYTPSILLTECFNIQQHYLNEALNLEDETLLFECNFFKNETFPELKLLKHNKEKRDYEYFYIENIHQFKSVLRHLEKEVRNR